MTGSDRRSIPAGGVARRSLGGHPTPLLAPCHRGASAIGTHQNHCDEVLADAAGLRTAAGAERGPRPCKPAGRRRLLVVSARVPDLGHRPHAVRSGPGRRDCPVLRSRRSGRGVRRIAHDATLALSVRCALANGADTLAVGACPRRDGRLGATVLLSALSARRGGRHTRSGSAAAAGEQAQKKDEYGETWEHGDTSMDLGGPEILQRIFVQNEGYHLHDQSPVVRASLAHTELPVSARMRHI